MSSVKEEAENFVKRRNAATKEITGEERKLLAKWREGQVTEDTTILGGGEGIEVTAPMTASVWKIQVKEGEKVKEGQVLAILEAMKMEIRKCGVGGILQLLMNSTSCRCYDGRQINRKDRCSAWYTTGSRAGCNVFEGMMHLASLGLSALSEPLATLGSDYSTSRYT